MANPAWASQLEVVWGYQPANDGQGGVATPMVPKGRNAPEVDGAQSKLRIIANLSLLMMREGSFLEVCLQAEETPGEKTPNVREIAKAPVSNP